MLKAYQFETYSYITSKITSLVKFLQLEKEKYDLAADSITDRQLRDTVRALAQANNQYSCELLSQLYAMGVADCHRKIEAQAQPEELIPLFGAPTNMYKDAADNLLLRCCKSAKLLITAYRDILNEPNLSEDVRSIMRYQLNGIMYAYLQLKLLRSVRMGISHVNLNNIQ
jgi:hypothetical protein